ncbi:thioredoxin domain-containing protein [Tsukamurella paurometabola]|uniref:Thioredoxin domain-containing protein n=1 Tax=Tsukamurella paurometabola TaxID=2061 RepID=A0ABS5NI20_TSUPA|nr:thioredoxin domain-containing protein [Tsukamurella paurometabola]MBS4103939.1 thioredoxin domain-containing protein [Tsukamurella paurometabola]UEA82636.1 DsbA family protein [Tsukamurella paurometabola]
MSKGKNAKYVPAKQSNTMTYVLGGIAVLVVIVVVIGGVLLLSKKEGTPADKAQAAIDKATPSFVLGKADAPTKLTFFEDAYCPACGNMERAYGEQITKAVEDGKLQITFFMLSFLNRQSPSGDYSDRAAGGLLAIAKSSLPEDQKQKAWLGAHTAMYANQPEEGKGDKTNAEIAKVLADGAKAKGVELPADVVSAISEGKYATDAATTAGEGSKLLSEVNSTGTPTVVHNGVKVEVQGDWLTPLLK